MQPILTADDYAMTDGVSRAIEALAHAGRLSATSVMTTMPDWPMAATRLREFRDRLSIGLHLNLTLGAPSGPMLRLAPSGMLPALSPLIQAALLGHLSPDEIKDEIGRQLDAFERCLGFPPDHVDGHQHVQVLPVVRQALLDAVATRYSEQLPLLRIPTTPVRELASLGAAGAKALTVTVLAAGFGRAARVRGIPANAHFAGFSTFDMRTPFVTELTRALGEQVAPGGGCAIVMCHPAYADAALAAIDPVVERRQQELDALLQVDGLPTRIWHVRRGTDGAAIDWRREMAT